MAQFGAFGKSGMSSVWAQQPNSATPPASNGKGTLPQGGYGVGVPTVPYTQSLVDKKDRLTLSAQNSIFNKPLLYIPHAKMNIQANWLLNGNIGVLNGPQDITPNDRATVGGSINGYANGAGLQITQHGMQKVVPQPPMMPVPPVPMRSGLKFTGMQAVTGPQIRHASVNKDAKLKSKAPNVQIVKGTT